MPKSKMLSYEQAKWLYDRIGAKQDTQSFYERPALANLVAHLELGRAERVVEFGCGTGAFAKELLERFLPPDACYFGFDVSSTMVELTQGRTAQFGSRAVIRKTSGAIRVDLPDGAFDHFISNYVLDLLSEEDIASLLSEAYRVLMIGGLLGVVGLTKGSLGLSRVVAWTWKRLHQFSPMLVGGCRPITIEPFFKNLRWRLRYRNVSSSFAIASEVVVAEKV